MGIYALNFYALGLPVTITIDDYIPYLERYGPPFVGSGPDESLWGALVEKALAKMHGSYEAIQGGIPIEGVRRLTGYPGKQMMHTDITVDELWNEIQLAIGEKGLLTSGSQFGTGSDKNYSENGIAYSHAYTMLGA